MLISRSYAWRGAYNVLMINLVSNEKQNLSFRVVPFALFQETEHYVKKQNNVLLRCETEPSYLSWYSDKGWELAYLKPGSTDMHTYIYIHKHIKPSLIRLQLIQIEIWEKCCSQLSTYFKRHVAFRKADESLVCSGK
jgi:hypothetical protein